MEILLAVGLVLVLTMVIKLTNDLDSLRDSHREIRERMYAEVQGDG